MAEVIYSRMRRKTKEQTYRFVYKIIVNSGVESVGPLYETIQYNTVDPVLVITWSGKIRHLEGVEPGQFWLVKG